MNRIALALCFMVATAATTIAMPADPAQAATWAQDEVAGPANNEVIVDTGAMTSGSRAVTLMVHSTLPGTFEFQLVDTDGTTVLKKQKLSVVSGQADFALSTNVTIDIAADQRLRIVAKQALTLGTVGASIWTQ